MTRRGAMQRHRIGHSRREQNPQVLECIACKAKVTASHAVTNTWNAVNTAKTGSRKLAVGITYCNAANRLMYVAADVDDARLVEIRGAIIGIFETFRTTGEIKDYEDHRQGIADYMAEVMEHFSVAAFTILRRGLRNQGPTIVPKMKEHVLGHEPDVLKERPLSRYQAAKDLGVLAVSPNADALPGACVITDKAEAAGR